MLNGEGNENGIKINRCNQEKNLHVQHTFFSNQQKKKQISTYSTLFVFFCVVLHNYNAVLQDQNAKLTSYTLFLWRNCRMCLCAFVSCVHVRFYFSLPHIFTLLAASITQCLTSALNFHVFLPTKLVSFVFNHSLQLFLCYPLECKHEN